MKYKITPVFLLLVVLLCTTINVFSQKLDVVWGKEIQPDKKGYISEVVGYDDNGYYAIREQKNKSFLIRYNNDHEVEFEKEIKTKIGKIETEWEGIYMFQKNFVLFVTYKDKKVDRNKLYAIVIDFDGTQHEPVLIDEIEYKKKKNAGSFHIYMSEDRENVLVYHNEVYDKTGYERFNYKMLSSNLDLVWEKPVELPYKDKAFSISKCVVDEDGNVFVLGLLQVDKKTSKHKMFAYYHKKDRMEEVNVDFAKAYRVSDLTFTYKDGELVFIGFYSDTKKDQIRGIVYTKIDAKSLAVNLQKNSEFSKKDLAKIIGEKAAQKGKTLPQTFDLRDLIFMPNGDVKLVAEMYYVHEVTTTDNRGVTRTTYYYYYRTIMVVNLNSKTGDIHWVGVIPKTQVSVNDRGIFSSFIMAYDNDKMYFLYNDNVKNTSPKTKPEKRGRYATNTLKIKKLVVTLVTMDNKGNIESELFFKSKNDGKTVLKPKFHARFSGTKVLIFAVWGKIYKFGFFTVN
jgi:hypothetical protein